jgi:hypothetical protein
MPPADVPVLSRQVIVAGPQHLARHTLEEAAEAAERVATRTGQSYIGSRVLDKQQRDSQFEAQMELDGHFVQVGLQETAYVSVDVKNCNLCVLDVCYGQCRGSVGLFTPVNMHPLLVLTSVPEYETWCSAGCLVIKSQLHDSSLKRLTSVHVLAAAAAAPAAVLHYWLAPV